MSKRGTPGHIKDRFIKGHVIQNRTIEALFGAVLFVVGAILVWDAFDNRGKELPWPLSAVLPW